MFDKNKIEELLSGVTADKVIEAYTIYQAISEVLTMYRKTRRNSSKDEFSKYIEVSQEWLLRHIEEFRFMNTGDIILLNAFANIKQRYEKLGIKDINDKEIIKDAIFIVREIIKLENDNNASLLTKNNTIFNKVQTKINNLQNKYEFSFS